MKARGMPVLALFVMVFVLLASQSVAALPVPQLVKDINPGGNGILVQIDRTQTVNINGTLYFTAQDGTHGIELWKSDGSIAGTVMVKDIFTGYADSWPTNFANVGGKLFFNANDNVHGKELWVSDGSEAGTHIVDIRSGALGSDPANLTTLGNLAIFTADDGIHNYELWKSDGSPAATSLLKDFGNPATWPYQFEIGLTTAGSRLFFAQYQGTYQYQLWATNGETAGTQSLGDYGALSGLTNVNGKLFYSAYYGDYGSELWKSDGTPAGTALVKNINPVYQNGSDPVRLVNVNGTLFFAANDSPDPSSPNVELWKSDGSAAGTVKIKEINPTSSSMAYGCQPYQCPMQANVNGTLFFVATDGVHNYELWKSNGSEAGTLMVKDIQASSGNSKPTNLTAACGRLFFVVNYNLWMSDGTDAGTLSLKMFNTPPALLTAVGDWLFFAASDGVTGTELWKVLACPTTLTFLPLIKR